MINSIKKKLMINTMQNPVNFGVKKEIKISTNAIISREIRTIKRIG